MEDTTINISLNDENSKNIIEVLGNETCKKILNLLAEKEYTETEISEKLKIPLNTVDYNTKKLIKAGLIESSSHWWSAKGKKMPSYKVANKQIIISPRRFSSKVLLLPLLIIGGALSFAVKKFSELGVVRNTATDLIQESTPNLMKIASPADLASTASDTAQIIPTSSGFAGWEWFLIGIWLGIVLFFVLSYLFETKFNRRSKK